MFEMLTFRKTLDKGLPWKLPSIVERKITGTVLEKPSYMEKLLER